MKSSPQFLANFRPGDQNRSPLIDFLNPALDFFRPGLFDLGRVLFFFVVETFQQAGCQCGPLFLRQLERRGEELLAF